MSTNEQLIAKYNPNNARNLTAEDLAEMRTLTNDQLKVLAEAYPNGARHKAYLVLFDTNVAEDKQMHNLSTWQNLYNVRKFSNLKNLVPYTFRDIHQKPTVGRSASVSSKNGGLKGVTARKVIDLSANEAAAELKANKQAAGPMTAAKAKNEDKAAAKTAGASVAQPGVKNEANRTAQVAAKPGKQVAAPAPKAPAKAPGKAALKAVPAADAKVPADQDFADPTNDQG